MLPKIHPGDLVIAKLQTEVNDGEIAVCVNDGDVLIKKVQKIPDENGERKHYLTSLNNAFPSFLASDDFRIEGLVRGVLSYSTQKG